MTRRILPLLFCLLAAFAAARAEGLRLLPDFVLQKGHVTLYWQDDAGNGPYTLTYQRADGTPDAQAVFIEEEIEARSFTVDYMAPGAAYSVTLTDSLGREARATIALPEPAPFADGKLTADRLAAIVRVCAQPRDDEDADAAPVPRPEAAAMDGSLADTRYGVRFELRYPELAAARTLDTLLVFRAPGGFTFAYNLGEVTYPRFRTPVSYFIWNFVGGEFFDTLDAINGAVPRGVYTVTCYLDGMQAAEADFEIR